MSSIYLLYVQYTFIRQSIAHTWKLFKWHSFRTRTVSLNPCSYKPCIYLFPIFLRAFLYSVSASPTAEPETWKELLCCSWFRFRPFTWNCIVSIGLIGVHYFTPAFRISGLRSKLTELSSSLGWRFGSSQTLISISIRRDLSPAFEIIAYVSNFDALQY